MSGRPRLTQACSARRMDGIGNTLHKGDNKDDDDDDDDNNNKVHGIG